MLILIFSDQCFFKVDRQIGRQIDRQIDRQINRYVLQGDSCTFGFQANSRSGLNVYYETVDSKGKKGYIQMVISDSGFIVTAYPRRKARQSDWGYRKKKENQE